MKKLFISLLAILFVGCIGTIHNYSTTVISHAANNEVALSEIPVSTFAGGSGTNVSYSNDGVKMLISGADTSGTSDAWRNYAVIPSVNSSKTFSLANNDKISIEISAKLFDASGNQISKSQNSDALDIYIYQAGTENQLGLLRIWTNAWGSRNGNHSYHLYGNGWDNQGTGLAIMGDATEDSSFFIQLDKENFISSYVSGQEGIVPLGTSSIISDRKEALKDIDQVYFKIQGENGFTNETQITIKSINGQSLANDGTNFIDDVAPTFNDASVNKTLMINEPYEIPVEANDVLSDVTYKVRIDGVETEGKTFTPTTKGTMNVTLIASDSVGNISEKEFTFEISDGIEKPTIVSLPTIDDLTINPLTYITFDKPVIEDTTGAAKTILKMYDVEDNLIAAMEENSDHKFAYYVDGSFVGGTYKLVYEVTNSAGTTISDPIDIKIEIKVKDKVSFISTDTSNMFAEYVDSGIALSSSDNFKQFNLGTFDLDDEFDIKFIVNSKTINGVNNDTNYVNLILISEENEEIVLMYRVWIDHSGADRPTNVYISKDGGISYTDITETGWISRNVNDIEDCYHMGFNKDDTFFGERTGGLQRVDKAYEQINAILDTLSSKRFSVRLETSNLGAGTISNFEMIVKEINGQSFTKPITWNNIDLNVKTNIPETISLSGSLDIDVYVKDIQGNEEVKLNVVDPDGETNVIDINDGKVNYQFNKLGVYKLTFVAKGTNGVEVKKEFSVTCKSVTGSIEIQVDGKYESTYDLNSTIKILGATYSDNVVKSSINVIKPNGEKVSVTANEDYKFDKPGIYKIIYEAMDNAEPTPNSATKEFIINIPDTLKPVVEVNLKDSYNINEEVKLDIKVTDDSEYDVIVTLTKPDGTSEKSTSKEGFVYKVTIEGKYTVKVVVEDIYGNKETIIKEFNVLPSKKNDNNNSSNLGLILGISGAIVIIAGGIITFTLLKKKKVSKNNELVSNEDNLDAKKE